MALFYKLWTHDYCSPLRGGKPAWDGTLPFTLPTVELDTSAAECERGWNFVDDLAKGFQIAGMWPNGRPSCVSIIEPSEDAIHRGDKWRSSSGKIVRFATEVEIAQGVQQFSKVFKGFESEMASEQISWRYALGRPENNEKAVVEHLEAALEKRSLKWTVKKYKTARDAWVAWDARAAWDAWDARAARDAWDARAAWAARDAWDALIHFFAGAKKWISAPPDLLTTGLRDAYINGLEIALPTEKDILGYAMKEK